MATPGLSLSVKEAVVGDTIDGRYLLRREIAAGGMGTVYEAQQLFTGRTVALKVLHGHLARDPHVQERLLREARALATVRHPSIVEVLDAGNCTAGPFMVLEMIEGRTLDGILAVKRPPLADTIRVIRQVCEALAFAHARGVVHRDIKPSNIFLTRNEIGQEVVKLIDFGVAAVPNDGSPVSARKLTRAGELIGTPEYMAPEQLVARPDIDLRCDVYATAATLFECLTGEAPYSGSYPEIMMKVMSADSPPLASKLTSSVSAALDRVLTAALAKEPERRTPDMLTFARHLEEVTGHRAGHSSLLGEFPTLPGVRRELTHGPSVPTPADARAAAPPTAEQRRRFDRAPFVTPARIFDRGGKAIDGRTEDISEGGLLVLTTSLVQDQEVRVRFALPISGQIVETKATSRWVREARGRHAIGLELINPEPQIKETIARYVKLMKGGV